MKLKAKDYLDFEKMNNLLDDFNRVTGFVTAVLDLEGNVLSKSGWRQICTDFHRRNPESVHNCLVSDTQLAMNIQDEKKLHFYKCMNGLIDVAVPIVVKGEHIANLFSGQFFFENPDIDFFRKQAKKFGFEEQPYLEALAKVPVVALEEVESSLKFLKDLMQMVVEISAEKLEQVELNETIKRSENALLESQIKHNRNMNDLLESQRIAHIGTWSLDIATNQVVWSEELYKMYGFDPSFPPPPYSEHMKLFTSKSWDELSKSLSITRTSGIPYELELETVTSNGSNGWMWVRGQATRDTTGKIVSLWGVAQDITERKLIQENLTKQNNLFTSLLEVLPVGVFMVDAVDGKPLIANKKGTELLGRGILHDASVHDLSEVYKAYKSESLEVYPTAEMPITLGMKGVSAHIDDMIIEHPDGTRKFLEVFGAPVKDNLGVPWASLVTYMDISERKEHEDKLHYLAYHDQLTGMYNRRSYEEKLKEIDNEDNLPLSIIMCDINGLKLVNDSFGHEAGDLLLNKTTEIIVKASRERDYIFRIGGDEFAILLPLTSAEETLNIVNSIEKMAASEHIYNIELSIACGFDTKTDKKQSFAETIANADNYMYRHKLYARSSIKSKSIDIIMKALFEKSSREAEHSVRVSNICQAIASALKLDFDAINRIKAAGLVHDIGKIGIDEMILNKSTLLDVKEWSEVKKHPEIGWRILSASIDFFELANFVLNHHERWDGLGYPNGISGENIPIEARIIALADAFDAMTNKRSYRNKVTIEQAIEEIKKCSGKQFDPKVVDAFVTKVLKR